MIVLRDKNYTNIEQREYGLKNWWREKKYQRAKWTGRDPRSISFWTMINPLSKAHESFHRLFHPWESIKDAAREGKQLLTVKKHDPIENPDHRSPDFDGGFK